MTDINRRTTHGVVEVPSSDGLLDWSDIVRVWIALHHDLHTFAQASELIADVARSAQTLELQELLVTELLRVVRLRPLFPHVQQGEVVAACAHEILPRLVSV